MTDNSRQKLIDRFQRMPGFNAIVLSPLAVGFGVNIQAANHVVHFTRTWNPAKEDQATDRAYRIGQERDVTVYYPSVVGQGFDSFDTVLHKLLSWKRGLAEDLTPPCQRGPRPPTTNGTWRAATSPPTAMTCPGR